MFRAYYLPSNSTSTSTVDDDDDDFSFVCVEFVHSLFASKEESTENFAEYSFLFQRCESFKSNVPRQITNS